eukprot:3531190-Prymnesium_polylepis.1
MAWPRRACSGGRWLAVVNAARDAAASCARQTQLGDRRSPSYFRLAARPGCSPTAFTAGGAAEPVAGAKSVSIVQNISGDLLDGGAEAHHFTDDAGDRASSLDDDEQRAGRAARSALALLAPPCGVG